MAQNGGSRRGQGGKLWAGARGYACSDCCEGGPDGETSLMSNDKSIVPALSAAELAYQCNGTALPCKLHWYPGKNCYKITNATFSAGVPGYAARAAKLGYRTVAAASGTTANVLQYGLMLGFSPDELVLLRLVLPPLLRRPPPPPPRGVDTAPLHARNPRPIHTDTSRGWAPIIRQTGIRQTACNTDTVQRGARRPWRPGCSPPTTTRSSRSCSAPRRSGPALGA
jgi:hypothetical protein